MATQLDKHPAVPVRERRAIPDAREPTANHAAAWPTRAAANAGLRDPLLASLVDTFACALIVVDRDQRIVHANAAGLALLDEGGSLRRDETGQLTAVGPTRPVLARMLAGILDGACEMLHGGASLVLTNMDGTVRIGYLRALAPTGTPTVPHALLALPQVIAVGHAHVAAFGSAYGLTMSEQRVLLQLANGCTARTAAAALGIGEATLTTHLKHIFDKTGARRQTEVVALLLRSLPPLLP